MHAQREQRRWIVQFVKGREHQSVAPTGALDSHRGVRRQVGGHALIGGVELASGCVELDKRIGRSAERAANIGPCGLPCSTLQKLVAGVCPALARSDEHVVATESIPQSIKRAKGIAVPVDTIVGIQDQVAACWINRSSSSKSVGSRRAETHHGRSSPATKTKRWTVSLPSTWRSLRGGGAAAPRATAIAIFRRRST